MTCPALGPRPSPFHCLSPGPGSELFSLHPHSGELLTAAPLIRAERPHYVLTLSAHDQGSPPRSSSLQLLVQVWLPRLQSVHLATAVDPPPIAPPSLGPFPLSECYSEHASWYPWASPGPLLHGSPCFLPPASVHNRCFPQLTRLSLHQILQSQTQRHPCLLC